MFNFWYQFFASLLDCSLDSYRSSYYYNSNVCRSFSHLKARARIFFYFWLTFLRARKSDTYCYCNNWKSYSYMGIVAIIKIYVKMMQRDYEQQLVNSVNNPKLFLILSAPINFLSSVCLIKLVILASNTTVDVLD